MVNEMEREDVEAHWEYTSKAIQIVIDAMHDLSHYLYVEAMLHGYKHGKEDG